MSATQQQTELDLVAITVSVNYAKKLAYIASRNTLFFKRWYIVTEESDEETRHVCALYPNITVLFHKFKNSFSTFDKGAGLKKAQLLAHAEYPDSNMLILDSDILLPTIFPSLVKSVYPLAENTIYGTDERRDFTKISDFISNKNYTIYVHSRQCIGFCTLYKSKKHMYKPSYNCGRCDVDFKDLFANAVCIPNLIVVHLGREGVNWNGVKVEDFTWDV